MGGTTQPASGGPQAPLPGARSALVLLLLINLFNYIDRQVLAAVEPNIRAEFFPVEDDLTKFWMGLLQFAFMVTYMLASPVFGVLAERYRRWSLVAIGVAVWTLASGGSRLATAFGPLLLPRGLCRLRGGGCGIRPAPADALPCRRRGGRLRPRRAGRDLRPLPCPHTRQGAGLVLRGDPRGQCAGLHPRRADRGDVARLALGLLRRRPAR